MHEVQQRDVPEQFVLTEQRKVREPEVQGWLREGMDRLVAAAQQHGGVARPIFVVYHGQFLDGGVVPVEVCVPVATSLGDATRREPAHREAYVRLTKAEVVPEQMGSVFGTVMQWLESQGLTIADAPREVYFTDFNAAAPADEVLDVAFPIG